MNTYEIIVADDHTLLRQGLIKIIADFPGFKVIGEAENGIHLLEVLKSQHPDIIVLDINMPHMRGLEAIPEIKRMYPDIKILVLSMHKEREFFNNAIKEGANGYLLKNDADQELFVALKKISTGNIYISPRLMTDMASDFIKITLGDMHPKAVRETLTHRERQVLKLIAEGQTAKEIGGNLFISSRTVEQHRFNIKKKLNVKRSVDLIRYASHKGYT